MDLSKLSAILALAPRPTAEGAKANPTGDMLRMAGTFVIFGLIFYFILIRPQQKRAKQQAEMLKSIKRGDKVVTSGGVLGLVVTVKDKSVVIRSEDAKMEITKSAVAEIVERSADSSSES
jgi:preprotein translocase subunit YajC